MKAMKIFYDLNGSLYANITNKCPCACEFCIRMNDDTFFVERMRNGIIKTVILHMVVICI